jgi:hypothetical protein
MSDWERMASDRLREQRLEYDEQQQERLRAKERQIARLREIVTALGIEQDLSDINASTTFWGGRGTISCDCGEFGARVRLAATMPHRIERTLGGGTKTKLIRAHYENFPIDDVDNKSGNSYSRQWVPDQRVTTHRQLVAARTATREVWIEVWVGPSWSDDEYHVSVNSSNGERRDAYGRTIQPVHRIDQAPSIGTYPFERYDHEVVRAAMRERLLQCVIEQRQLESVPSAEARLDAELQQPENQPGTWYAVSP